MVTISKPLYKPHFFYSPKLRNNFQEVLNGRERRKNELPEEDVFSIFTESIPNDFLGALFPRFQVVYEHCFLMDVRFAIRERDFEGYYESSAFYVTDLETEEIDLPIIKRRFINQEYQ